MDLKLDNINNSNVKMAEHWRKLTGLFGKEKYIEELGKRANQDKYQLEQKAARKLQAWWRRIFQHRVMLRSHKENVQIVQEIRNTPCSDENQIEKAEAVMEIQTGWRGNSYRRRKVLIQDKEKMQISFQEEVLNVALPCSEEENISKGETNRIQIVREAVTKIQAWWRGISYRHREMLPEHKEKLRICVQQIRNAPCSEENPREERSEPLNLRIGRYVEGLLSTVLTERKAVILRLNRLAERSHVAIECMLRRNIFQIILDCFAELNRSEAHLYVIRPLSALVVKLLLQKPFVDPFALEHLDGLLSVAIHLIHNNYKDLEVVSSQAKALNELSNYKGFAEKLIALRFDWYMQKFKSLFGGLKQNQDARSLAYNRLCKLHGLVKASQTPNFG